MCVNLEIYKEQCVPNLKLPWNYWNFPVLPIQSATRLPHVHRKANLIWNPPSGTHALELPRSRMPGPRSSGTISISRFNLHLRSLRCSRNASYKARALPPSHITQLVLESLKAAKTALTGQYRQGSRNTNPLPFGRNHSMLWSSSCNLWCWRNSLPTMNE